MRGQHSPLVFLSPKLDDICHPGPMTLAGPALYLSYVTAWVNFAIITTVTSEVNH